MESIESLIGLVSEKVGDVANSDVVIGDPIELGEVTIVPLSRITLGFGGGGGAGEGEAPRKRGRHQGAGRGTGGGGGGGGKVRPVGVIIFGPDGVEVQPIGDKRGVLDKLFDKIPEFAERIKAIVEGEPEPAKTTTDIDDGPSLASAG